MHKEYPSYKELADTLKKQQRTLLALQASMAAISEYAMNIGGGARGDITLAVSYAEKIGGIADLECFALDQLQDGMPCILFAKDSPLYHEG